MSNSGPPRRGEPRVEAARFQKWLTEQGDIYGEAEVAKLVGGRSVRWLYRYRNGRQETSRGSRGNKHGVTFQLDSFPRSVVEDALHCFRPGLFYDMYPEYAFEQDIVLEPDAWCPWCTQMVTPIDGLCPFCECEHGHLFREVGITEDGFACLACLAEEHRERSKTWPSHLTRAPRKKAA